MKPFFLQVKITYCSFRFFIYLVRAGHWTNSKSRLFTWVIGSSDKKFYWLWDFPVGEHLLNLWIILIVFYELFDLNCFRIFIFLIRLFLVTRFQFPIMNSCFELVASDVKLPTLSHDSKKGLFWFAAKTCAKIDNFVSFFQFREISGDIDFFEFLESSLFNLANHLFALFWVITESKQIDQRLHPALRVDLVAFPACRQAIHKNLAFWSQNHSELIRVNYFLEVSAVCWLFNFSEPPFIFWSSQSFAHRKYLLILANKEHTVLMTDHLLRRRNHARVKQVFPIFCEHFGSKHELSTKLDRRLWLVYLNLSRRASIHSNIIFLDSFKSSCVCL